MVSPVLDRHYKCSCLRFKKYGTNKNFSKEGQSKIQRYKKEQTKLKVTFSNGPIIYEDKAINTFIKTVQEFGIEKVSELRIGGEALIISDKEFNDSLHKKYKQISNTKYYLRSDNNTITKKEHIEKIARMLRVEVSVEIVAK